MINLQTINGSFCYRLKTLSLNRDRHHYCRAFWRSEDTPNLKVCEEKSNKGCYQTDKILIGKGNLAIVWCIPKFPSSNVSMPAPFRLADFMNQVLKGGKMHSFQKLPNPSWRGWCKIYENSTTEFLLYWVVVWLVVTVRRPMRFELLSIMNHS